MEFNADAASKYDEWYRKDKGKYADAQEKELFLRLVQPQRGQSLLEVGCGTGHNLEFFRRLGLTVTGIDLSEPMLQIAARRLGPEARLSLGQANMLEFDDNSFDIVTLITLLEFLPNPAGALKEATRVARDKVYVGILNKASVLGITRRVENRFRKNVYKQAKFFTIWEIKEMAKETLDRFSLTWESVLFFPLGWHRCCHQIDRLLSFHRNPFGAFLGIHITKPHRTSTQR